MTGTIDLSLVPAPSVVETLSFETILSAMLNGDSTTTPPTPGLLTLDSSFANPTYTAILTALNALNADPSLAAFVAANPTYAALPGLIAALQAAMSTPNTAFTALVESDPAYKILEVCAYRELLIRQQVNDSAQAVMLAYATGSDLEQLGALFGVTRNTITPANSSTFPATAAVMESDASLRTRIQLSLDGFSTAGPVGAYKFWALSAAGTIKDCSVVGPPTVAPGNVVVTIMSNASADGTPSSAEITAVTTALNAQDVRPITDCVTVQGVTTTPYAVTATIYGASGPDSATIMANALASVQALVASKAYVGLPVRLSSLYAALSVPGVSSVVIASPTADVIVDYAHTAYCPLSSINLTWGGVEL